MNLSVGTQTPFGCIKTNSGNIWNRPDYRDTDIPVCDEKHTGRRSAGDGDGYEAVIEISDTINLYGLAEHIIDTIGFDFDHAFGFYDNLKNPYKSKELYTLFADMEDVEDDGEPGVNRTFIGEVFKKGKRMLFLFDYGDDWKFLLTCTKSEAAKTKRKVRKIVSEKGEAPIQYPNWEEEDEPDEDDGVVEK